ncbi:unnamed protein product [Cylindrotheca closterium]|uniref:Uncharacterized protein n=1 Tax=Cylindrotheca closterium TaxID=2856 RepID=A0AAD2CM62_9STRA|nr:unnamed protein product [Cylindrotheca closterium]
MTTSLHDSIASLDLASLNFNVADIAEVEFEVMKDQEKAETVSREDLMSSFSKFDSLVTPDDFSEGKEDDGSVDIVKKFLNHYEAAHHDITADLRAFQSSIGTLIPETKDKENRKTKKGPGKKRKESRKKSDERRYSVERRLEEADVSPVLPNDPPQVNTSSAALQDLPHAPPMGGKDDLTGMSICADMPLPVTPSASSFPERSGTLPDASTMSAKEILAELKGLDAKNMNFIEKSEMIAALKDARSSANCTTTNRTQKPPKPAQNRTVDGAPSTPRASRTRGRSTEPSPRSISASPIRAHLNNLMVVMDLEISDEKEPKTPRQRKKGLKKVRSKSAGTFDVGDSSPVKTSSSWWNLSSTEETSKSSKESKSSRRKKGMRKARSSNALGDDDNILAARLKLSKSSANDTWDLTQTPGRRRRKGLKKSNSNPLLDIDALPLSGAFITSKSNKANSALEETPKTRNRSKLKGRSKSNDSPLDVDNLQPRLQKKNIHSWWNMMVGDESSKSSKESKSSRRKRGLRKAKSNNAIDDFIDYDDDDIAAAAAPKFNGNASWDLTQTPGRRRKKGLKKSNSNPLLDVEPPLPGAFVTSPSKANDSFGLGGDEIGTKKKKKKKRSMSLRRSSSNPTLGVYDVDGNDDGSSKRSKESAGRKKGLRKSSSGSKLDIDAILADGGGLSKKNKRSMSLRRSASNPTLGIHLHSSEEDGSSKRSKDSGGRKKKGMRKNRRADMRKSRSNPTIDVDIPREIFADVIAAPKANFSWDDLRGGVKGKNQRQQQQQMQKQKQKKQPYKEKQTVLYTSTNGEKEEAVIVKVYLDDLLVPFYDIKLSKCGKEKQTDDNHLSAIKSTTINNTRRTMRSQSVDAATARRSKSMDVATAARGRRVDASPVSVRRRLKKQAPGAPNIHKSPVSMRQKLSSAQSPGSLRKVYRCL